MHIVATERNNSGRMKIVAGLLVSAFVIAPGIVSSDERRPRRQADDARLTERIPWNSATSAAGALEFHGRGVTPGNAIPNGVGWLDANQNPSGSWGSTFEFADTATNVRTLGDVQPAGDPFGDGVAWLTAHLAVDNDELSREISALSTVEGADLDSILNDLIASRSPATSDTFAPNYPEGGWGLESGFETDSLTTALALQALENVGRKAGIGVVNEALAPAATNVHEWEIAEDALTARIRISVSGSDVRLRMT